jgi:magnesium-transporting ATPase (P-type)
MAFNILDAVLLFISLLLMVVITFLIWNSKRQIQLNPAYKTDDNLKRAFSLLNASFWFAIAGTGVAFILFVLFMIFSEALSTNSKIVSVVVVLLFLLFAVLPIGVMSLLATTAMTESGKIVSSTDYEAYFNATVASTIALVGVTLILSVYLISVLIGEVKVSNASDKKDKNGDKTEKVTKVEGTTGKLGNKKIKSVTYTDGSIKLAKDLNI